MDYIKDVEQLTGYTSTYVPPTQAECVEYIRRFMCRYAAKKWYEPKKKLLEEAIYYADLYNKIDKIEE